MDGVSSVRLQDFTFMEKKNTSVEGRTVYCCYNTSENLHWEDSATLHVSKAGDSLCPRVKERPSAGQQAEIPQEEAEEGSQRGRDEKNTTVGTGARVLPCL